MLVRVKVRAEITFRHEPSSLAKDCPTCPRIQLEMSRYRECLHSAIG